MDKTSKYLYWTDEPDEEKKLLETVSRELYSRIGYIIHIMQMIEYNLANIISLSNQKIDYSKEYSYDEILDIKSKVPEDFQKLSRDDLVKLIKIVDKDSLLSNEIVEQLQEIRIFRNNLVHQYFITPLLAREELSIDKMESMIDELNDFEEKIATLNDKLVEVFKWYNHLKTR